MVIYKIENVENGKCYVGQTCRKPIYRFNHHMRQLEKGTHFNRHLQFAYNKSVSKQFKFSILDNVAFRFGLNNLEIFWIKKLNTIENGYNLVPGGSGITGFTHSKEARNKIGIASKNRGGGKLGAKKLCGIKRSESFVYKVKKANTGKKRTNEQCKRIALVKIGNKNRCTPVIDSDGNIYNSITDAAKIIGCKPDSIGAVISGKRKTIYKLTFSYLKKVGG